MVAFKDAAVTSCQTLNPGASLLMPKSIHDQQVLEQFLKRSDLTSEIFLGAEKKESGHWFWDDEKQMFVSGKITPSRTPMISGLKSQILKPIFLS